MTAPNGLNRLQLKVIERPKHLRAVGPMVSHMSSRLLCGCELIWGVGLPPVTPPLTARAWHMPNPCRSTGVITILNIEQAVHDKRKNTGRTSLPSTQSVML